MEKSVSSSPNNEVLTAGFFLIPEFEKKIDENLFFWFKISILK